MRFQFCRWLIPGFALIALHFSNPAFANLYRWWQSRPEITTVMVNTEAGEIQIFGSGFDDPEVRLGSIILPKPHHLSEANELIVKLPDQPPLIGPGDYRLILSQGTHGQIKVDYDLTIGAGPTGEPGTACSISTCVYPPGLATLTCGAVVATIPCTLSETYAIGDTGPAGGTVFYVTHGGYHGLEVALDYHSDVEWGVRGR